MFRRPTLSIRDKLIALFVILGVNALGALPAVFFGAETDWIERPWFYPPEILFPIVWTLLFTLMGLAFFIIWKRPSGNRDVRIALLVFALQFGLNLAWTPVFFGLQRPDLGLLVIGMLWFSIIATIIVFFRINRLAALLLIPYFGWVSFAAVLNYAIYAAT